MLLPESFKKGISEDVSKMMLIIVIENIPVCCFQRVPEDGIQTSVRATLFEKERLESCVISPHDPANQKRSGNHLEGGVESCES